MRKISILLSILVLAAMLLTACGGQEEKNEAKNTQVPASKATSTSAVTSPGNLTTTPGIPVTGEENPARLSKELDFKVLDKNNNELGEVKDMVLDFDNARVAYVVVGTGGFLGIGEKKLLVPWDSLKLQTATNGGQNNAFILQTDANVLKNEPDFDLSTLPPLGQAAGTWDAQIRNYWRSGGKAVAATNTPAANAKVSPTMTATPSTSTSTSPMALKGVVLASKVLGSTVNVEAKAGTGTSNGSGNGAVATATAGTGTGAGTSQATATVGAAVATATAVAGPATSNTVNATIKDMIMDMKASKIQFIVVDAKFDDGEHWIPIPAKLFQWDASAQAFVLKVDAAALQKAPFFQENQFPNTATSGWDNEFNKFWRGK